MAKAGDILAKDNKVYIAFNSEDTIAYRELKLIVDPIAGLGLGRTESIVSSLEDATYISVGTAVGILVEAYDATSVSSEYDLVEALANAKSGDVIVIEKDMSITQQYEIPAGVTVTSWRGLGLEGAEAPTLNITVKLQPYFTANFVLNDGSTLSGLRFTSDVITKVELDGVTVIESKAGTTPAVIKDVVIQGTWYAYAPKWTRTIVNGIHIPSNMLATITDVQLIDVYSPLAVDGKVTMGNVTWNSGAYFTALPTLSGEIHGISDTVKPSRFGIFTNILSEDEITSWFDDNALNIDENMQCEVNTTPYTPEPPAPVTVPMALPDGSVLFYDRGASYGEYEINDSGYPERTDGAVDDGSAESQNWRYLICDQADLDNRVQQWGPSDTNEGLTNAVVGCGLPNTEAMVAKYSDNDTYWWKLIKKKKDSTGLKWFMPSKDEFNLVYENKNIITSAGGNIPQSNRYWSSSENDSNYAWYQHFSTGNQSDNLKLVSYLCRLLRRI